MNYRAITSENLEREPICCAISGNRDPQGIAKKAWLKERLGEGMAFLKAEERAKRFIESIPAEYALFCNGRCGINEILSEKKFAARAQSLRAGAKPGEKEENAQYH